MMAGTCALFWLTVYTCVYICTAQKIIEAENITAEVGQDVILPCKVPNNYILITAVEWIRPDQDPDHVLYYRDGYLDPHNQHPSYQNRVDLKDKDLKDGDFSLVLKNVMKNDTGRYECRVFEEGKVDPISIISIINLVVHLPGEKGGITGDGEDMDGGEKDGGNKDGGEKDGGKKGGNTGDGENKNGGNMALIFVLILGLTGLGFLGFLIYKLWIGKKPNNSVSTEAAETIPMSTFSQSAGPTTASAPLMHSSAEEQTEM